MSANPGQQSPNPTMAEPAASGRCASARRTPDAIERERRAVLAHGSAHRRTCPDCLRAYRNKHRSARKPWPERVYHYTGNRCCTRHAAQRAEQSTRQTEKRGKRAVSWADRQAIQAVYADAAARRTAGEDVQVDHIIPLLGKNVSGLHVPENLAVIGRRENIRKGNRY
jgi:hypothetical protein